MAQNLFFFFFYASAKQLALIAVNCGSTASLDIDVYLQTRPRADNIFLLKKFGIIILLSGTISHWHSRINAFTRSPYRVIRNSARCAFDANGSIISVKAKTFTLLIRPTHIVHVV